jgi:hypothetical protein
VHWTPARQLGVANSLGFGFEVYDLIIDTPAGILGIDAIFDRAGISLVAFALTGDSDQ